jgi:hypothetical protein
MNRRSILALIGATISACLTSKRAFADNDLAEAISHTQEALTHGRVGRAKALVTHATIALGHAEAADRATSNEHSRESITQLRDAIADGKKNDSKSATRHIEDALTHLLAAKSSSN